MDHVTESHSTAWYVIGRRMSSHFQLAGDDSRVEGVSDDRKSDG